MSKQDGRRDLSLIRASGSTARILNLALVAETHGENEEYLAKPLFRGKRLNATLLVKHAVRPHERDLFKELRSTATKIVFPFAKGELGLGGVSIMVGERNYERAIQQAAGYSDENDFLADIEVLRLLDSVPSFDPFLLRERLRHVGVEPARCYFDIAEADVARMRAFVSAEIAQLINLAFATGGRDSGDLSRRLAEKLMTDETAKSLDPLRETLRLSGEDYIEGVFAWKGFLYYKWLMTEFAPSLAEFKPRFAGLKIVRTTPEERTELAQMRREILMQMDQAVEKVRENLLEYGAAFASLADGQAGAFRSFLLKAPSMFIPIGEAVGVVRHIHSFWQFRFPDQMPGLMEAEEAMEVLHEFSRTLIGIEFVRPQAPKLAAL